MPSLPSLPTFLLTLLAILLLTTFLLPHLLSTFLPSLRLGSITPFALHNLSWTPSDPSSPRLEVARLGWSLSARKSGWVGIRASGVRVGVPSACLSSSGTPPAPPPSRPRRGLGPTARRLIELMAPLVRFVELEVEFGIELRGVLKVSGIISAGAEVGRAQEEGRRVGGWVGLEKLRVVELGAGALPALEVRERVTLGAKALVRDGEVKGGVEVEVLFGEGTEGVHVRVHELRRVLDSLEEARGSDRRPTRRKDDARINLLSFLHSISIRLPLFLLSAHYNTPPHIHASCPNRPLPLSVAFAFTVRGVSGKLVMGGTTDGASARREHVEWLGKERELGVWARFGWEEIEGRVKADGSEEDILPDSAKAFAIGPSSLFLTSTWLPPSLTTSLVSLPRPLPSLAPTNYNDSTLIAEISIGQIRGHTTFETLDSALRIFKARPKPPRRASNPRDYRAEEVIRALPRIVGTLACEGLEVRIQAPANAESREADGRPEEFFYRTWTSPDLLCVSFPNGSMSFGGEYGERSAKRTEAERRAARRTARRVEREKGKDEALSGRESMVSTPGEKEEEHWTPVKELEEELGVPPPPPIHVRERRHVLSKPDPNFNCDLDAHPLKYAMRVNLTTESLNVYILATNLGSRTPEDATGWLDDIPTLPSDPIRLDVFALGPVELSATQLLLGNEFVESDSAAGAAVPSLDLTTHSGEVSILVEAIGVDLWRPVVMGSLRDFLQSFASASATSTLRPPSSSSPTPPEPRPIVDLLPANLCIYFAVASLDLRVAGSDPKNDVRDVRACRGVAVHSGPLVFEYLLQSSLRPGVVHYPNRQSLDLPEDIHVEANSNVAEQPGVRQALFKLTAADVHLDPVVDARASRGHTTHRSSIGGGGRGPDDWELMNRDNISDLARRRKSILPSRIRTRTKGILYFPEMAFRVRLHAAPRDPDSGEGKAFDEVVVSVEAENLTLRVGLFNIYLCLVAVSAIKSLTPPPPQPSTPGFPKHAVAKRPPPLFSLRTEITDLHVFVDLPHDVRLFGHVRRLRVQASEKIGAIVEWDMLLLAGESQTVRSKWEDILRLRVTTISVRPEPDNSGSQPFVVVLDTESARLRIPFRYVVANIIDNTVNLVKATKQLVHQLVKGGVGFIIEPEVEQAKRLPKVELRVKMLAVEIQDDPFETRLNIIWRAGYEEQLARSARQAAFEAKVEAIRKMEAQEGEDESDSDSDDEYNYRTSRRPKVSGQHSIGVAEAWDELKAYDSSHWVKRIRNAIAEQGRREEALTRRLYGPRHNSQRPDALLPVEILPASRSAPLARATLQDVRFVISRPSFPTEELPDFLFDVGKGLPRDTDFSLLVPLHFSWKLEEARCQLRDYPLPLLHIPPMPHGGGHDFACWECEADLVIAEEMGGPESVRRVPCAIVPADSAGGQALYSMVVPRSAMTVKTYATPTVRIKTPYATRIGWGNSVAPAIQDVAKVLDTLSKASPDPSERIGFWDKIRLQFHWRVKVLFQGEGPVHFHLKGTRDPYALTGFGAGFSKSWRGNVKFLLGLENPDQEFFQIESDEYILGIPNLRDYVDNAATGLAQDPGENNDRSTQHSSGTGDPRNRFGKEAEFIKVCAKFINGVRWGLGAVLERACLPDCAKGPCLGQSTFHRQCRFFNFSPHWSVHTRTADSGIGTDSFVGFRSDFIHFSISLTSPLSLSLPSNTSAPLSPSENDGELGYNSLHFSPQAATHFWAWWKLFDGVMSLPIRQGKLFPSAQPPSKKFGKHCATIKYRFSLAPLFIAHTYRQDSWADWSKGETTVVGLKGKIARFNVDLHQREQEEIVRGLDSKVMKTVIHKTFYQAEVDCDGVDLRVISACFKEPEKQLIIPEDTELDIDEPPPSTQDYTVVDADLEWIDTDDFVDAIYSIPDPNPQVRILPFIVCPRFTYYRQKDARSKDAAEAENEERTPASLPKTKFGSEPSHTCLMGAATADTLTVQIESAKARLAELEAELRFPSSVCKDGPPKQISLRIIVIQRIIDRLIHVRDSLHAHEQDEFRDSPFDTQIPKSDPPYGRAPPTTPMEGEDQGGEDGHLPHITSTLYQEWAEWENRYMVHNPTIQVSNITRDVLLKYYYSSRERRGFVYHLSASAIKFLRDLTKETEKKHHPKGSRHKSSTSRTGSSRKRTVLEETQQTNRLLDNLLNSGSDGKFWASNESTDDGRRSFGFGVALDVDPESAADSLPDSFDLQPGHLCMFIKPQIALQSDVDNKSTIILTAFRAQLKVFSVVDLRTPDDPVNAQVLNQTFGTLDGLQAFYPREQYHRESRTGTTFVPLETLVDLRVEPWGFDRVVPRTSAALRYDKFNQLRMSSKNGYDDGFHPAGPQDNHFQTGTDRISVECDKFSVSANPDHFAAIYNVVTDLLLYSDPLQKSRSKKLEAIVFTHDFSNLSGATEIVMDLQQRIRALGDLAQQYQVHLDELDDDGRYELFVARAEFTRLSNELNLVVLAITRAQDFNGVAKTVSKTAGIQFEARASELVWHMLDKSDTPFTKFSVKGVEFSWISKQDSSISNRLVIKDLKALNSSPEQIFAEIIAKHEHVPDHELCKVDVFAAILWNALAPVGGISIVEQFELHLHPIRLQLEHRVGRQILDYIFSQRRSKPVDEEDDSTGSDTPPAKPSRQSLSHLTPNRTASRSVESLAISKTPNRSGQSSSAASINGDHRLRRTTSKEVLAPPGLEEGLDANEMRLRAALNRTFILVDFTSTVLCLTYRSEKEDHSRLPDIYNITYKTPSIQYRSKTWSFLDLLDELKRDIIKSVWSQKGALLGQLLQTAHRRLPLHDARSAAKASLTASLKSHLHLKTRTSTPSHEHVCPPPSPLRVTVKQSTGASSPGTRSSERDSPEAENGFPPFDVPLSGVYAPLTDEPESLSPTSASGSTTSTKESDSSTAEAHSLPLPSRNGLPIRQHGHSLPPFASRPNDSVGYPHHQPLTPTRSQHTDADKARMLLGKSFA